MNMIDWIGDRVLDWMRRICGFHDLYRELQAVRAENRDLNRERKIWIRTFPVIKTKAFAILDRLENSPSVPIRTGSVKGGLYRKGEEFYVSEGDQIEQGYLLDSMEYACLQVAFFGGDDSADGSGQLNLKGKLILNRNRIR